MSEFTEAKLEQVFIELLGNEGFPHFLGNTISRTDDEVLIEEDLKTICLIGTKTNNLPKQKSNQLFFN